MDVTHKLRLDGRVALVTGASSGLGERFAEVLAAAGAAVAIAARRRDRLDALSARITAEGGNVLAVEMDVTDAASVEAALVAVESGLGPIEVLVNNAGVATAGNFLDTSEAEWRSVLGVNLDGVIRVSHAVAARMAKRGAGGSIVNLASVLSFSVTSGLSAYAVSKAAVAQLTKAMALDLARHRIRVNALAPGYFHSEMTNDLLASERGKKMLAHYPMRRAGETGELDIPLLLLASGAGSYMTGSVITVDGGALLAGA